MTTLPKRFRRNAITSHLDQLVTAALAVVVAPIPERGLDAVRIAGISLPSCTDALQ